MNHLIVGLGGTGGKVIRAFRQLVWQQYRGSVPNGLRVGYLYIDSSREMMDADDPSWRVLGTSVQLPRASQLLIAGENLGERLDNVNRYPGIKPWIGDRQVWADVLGSIVGAALGGQKRRLGRFLLACKIEEMSAQLQTQVRELQQSGESGITFHVVTGLAGGTGSGCVLDVAAQIRSLYPDALGARIVLYTLIPESHPPPNWDTGNYHANGYAALIELNALSTGAYRPWDVAGIKGRLQLMEPFNGCYVFGIENEKGYVADVDREMPGIVAEFLYQKIVASSDLAQGSLRRFENAENGDSTPEMPEGAPVGERSKRFLTFGIKRVAIPEQEIAEYLTFTLGRQALLQLRYNNWVDGIGFANEPRNIDAAGYVRQREVEAAWLLDDDHLTLSAGILQDDAANKRWKPLLQEWESVLPTFKSLVREQSKPEAWTDELSKLFQKRFDQDYRTVGVPTFYRNKLLAKRDMAREIRSRVERGLFDEWRTGSRSLLDIARILAALQERISERISLAEQRASEAESAADEARQQLTAIAQEWQRLGIVGKLLGKQDQLFDAHGTYTQTLFLALTRDEAWGFAKQLLQDLQAEISECRADVDKAASTLQDCILSLDRQLAARLVDSEQNLKSHLIRFYEPDAVKRFATRLALDQEEQRTQTAEVRKRLADTLGATTSFRAFNERLGQGPLVQVLDDVCEERAQIAHANVATSTQQKILKVPILEKLRERYGNDPQQLQTFVGKLVSEAGAFAAFSNQQVQLAGAGINKAAQPFAAKTIVILPKSPEQAEFVNTIKAAFRNAQPGDLEFQEVEGRANEITIITLKNLFPLRYLAALPGLQQRYEQRLQLLPTRGPLEVHTEGDASAYPPLFVLSAAEVRDQGVPYLLIGAAIGLVTERPNPTTGKPQVLLARKDEDGFDTTEVLDSDLLGAAEKLDDAKLRLLRTDVTRRLTGEFLHADKREVLRQRIVDTVEKLKSVAGGDVTDARWQRFRDGGRKAVRILKGEA